MTLELPTRQEPVRHEPTSVSARIVQRAATALSGRGSDRRRFLSRAALVGSALAVAPAEFLLKPGTAYAAVCGSAATCDAGYTAFCCTINNGINACPPGTVVGGWWKADGSGFCGGSARYYIDCQGECTRCSNGCTAGESFCTSNCWNCSAHCASGTCDSRRVCWNVFRYGQCHQEVGCTGPVACRVVSCTPPWQVDPSCSTASATDNYTADHSAPCLTSQYWSPVVQHWQDLGGAGGFLGGPVEPEYVNPDHVGKRQRYAYGSVYWHPSTRAHAVMGLIRDHWGALAWETGVLGYPTTDELPCPDLRGRFNHFRNLGTQTDGSIYWHPSVGAHSVRGGIRSLWSALGWERSVIGYPTTDETRTPDGQGAFNHFHNVQTGTNGSIYAHLSSGIHEVHGAIRDRWQATGWERGVLGYPSTNETRCPDGVGRFNHFHDPRNGHDGSIYWTSATGAHAVYGAIRVTWSSMGWERGRLGYPTSDPAAVSGGLQQRFQHGVATQDSAGHVSVVYT